MSNANYSVDQALGLMARLPLTEMKADLIFSVVRATLESAGVRIDGLLDATATRQDELTNEIVRIQGEIANLNQEIGLKTENVQTLQNQLALIGSLRENLEG